MKLLTHNLLYCNVKHCPGAKKGYAPLRVLSQRMIHTTEQEFNPSFISRMLPRIDWPLLCSTLKDLKVDLSLPQELDALATEYPEELLQEVHKALFQVCGTQRQVEVLEGHLKCESCSRLYVIKNGIPNMLLNEDEV